MTALQRVDLGDRVAIEPSDRLRVDGFDDTIVGTALRELARRAGVTPAWAARIWKAIPVAAGLGGGSSDAATALRLANGTLGAPLAPRELEELAATLGADVPFFLRSGPQLGTGDGSTLSPLQLPQDFWVMLVLPTGARKRSTAEVYQRFDERGGADGFEERRATLLATLAHARRPRDLAALPTNDLASSDLALDFAEHGAFRADVSGAGPVVYGLFLHRRHADAAARAFRTAGR
ncbi:MAG: 4-(cytidine 5'-diphospho)-2-C-methyl-D-erythritol kinase, partial [Gaiellaceae bacterium]